MYSQLGQVEAEEALLFAEKSLHIREMCAMMKVESDGQGRREGEGGEKDGKEEGGGGGKESDGVKVDMDKKSLTSAMEMSTDSENSSFPPLLLSSPSFIILFSLSLPCCSN